MPLTLLFLLILALNPGAAIRPAAAETFGLVIGIDDYTGAAPRLQGAVNDARDVADALTKSGAREVRLLLDQGASRDAILAGWKELLGKARKNDILLFHYAGHGGQEPEHVKGSEPSGYDSTLLLAGFDVEGEGTYQRIIDDELGAMFKQASDAGINVLVAVDACHSGTMTRGFSAPGGAKPRVRAATYPPILITGDKLPPLDPAWAKIPNDLPNLIYFGAVQDDEEAPEVTIDGKSRGALSWALADGLRGGADTDHDGIITKEEIQAFVKENIRMQMEGRQHPSLIPQGFRAFEFRVKGAPAAAPVAAGPVRFAIVNTAGVSPGELFHSLQNVTPESAGTAALVWDVGRRQISAGPGNIVADFGTGFSRGIKRMESPAAPPAAPPAADGRGDLPKVQAMIDKWRQAEPTRPAEAAGALSLAILNVSTVPAPELAQALKGVRLAEAGAEPGPMLTWDVARAQVFTGLGDLVATFGTGADETRAFKRSTGAADAKAPADGRGDLPKLQGLVDKWRLVERIKRLAESRSLRMALKPDDKLHAAGAKITFVIDGHAQTYFTLFNLAADGTINFLYPLNTAEVKDPPQIPLGRPYTVPLEVEAPFGADHLVAIASADRLADLHKALQEFDGKAMADALEPVLLKQLEGQSYRIGIHGSYTAAAR
jgi:hypothetical protein